MSHIKNQWNQPIVDAVNGNAENAEIYLNEASSMGIISNQLLTNDVDLLTGTHISNDSSLAKSNLYVSHVINKNQKEKTASEEQLKNQKLCQSCNAIQAQVDKYGMCTSCIEEHAKLEAQTRHFPSAALKFDSNKPDMSQVSCELMEHLARVRMFGEKKYARNNWKKGFKVTRSLAAALRHIFATLRGELYDPESGLYHVAHAIASLEHALYDLIHHKENIDV